MIRINVLWKQVKGNNGKEYNIRYTTDFGFNCTISTKLKASRDENGNYYLDYDPTKAFFKANQNGFIELYVEE